MSSTSRIILIFLPFLIVHSLSFTVVNLGLRQRVATLSSTLSQSSSKVEPPCKSRKKRKRQLENLLKAVELRVSKDQIEAAIALMAHSKLSCQEMNYVATRMITLLGDRGRADHVHNVLHSVGKMVIKNEDAYCEETTCSPDSITLTTAMSVFVRHGMSDETIKVFREMRMKGVEMDEVSYSCAMRAFGSKKSWKDTMELLEESYNLFSQGSLHVVHTAMTNLKYGRFRNDIRRKNALWRLNALIEWMNIRKIVPCIQTIDIILAVLGKHKSVSDVVVVSSMLFRSEGTFFSKYTFNAILQNCLRDKNSARSMVELMQIMSESDLLLDETSYNSLLRMAIENEDFQGIDNVLAMMRINGINISDYTLFSLMMPSKKHNNSNAIVNNVNTELFSSQSSDISPHLYCNAISACGADWISAMKIFHRANTSRKIDTAVFISAAKICLHVNKVDEGFEIMNDMISRNFPITDHSLHFVIEFCLNEQIASYKNGTTILKQYLWSTGESNPELLTEKICQRVLENSLRLGKPELACDLHLDYFGNLSCKSHTLLEILLEMQKLSENEDPPLPIERKRILGRKSYNLIHVYSTRRGYDKSLKERRRLLRFPHFDSVLRTLVTAKMFDFVKKLFILMSGSGNNPYIWQPGIFTVAEFIRAARLSKNTDMALEVIKWALNQNTPLPFGVISDAISYVYKEGRTDIAFEMYREIYKHGMIQHWSCRDTLEIDLHRFNRGMAYSAIRCVFEEILMSASWLRVSEVPLTVITGKNEKIRESSDSSKIDGNSHEDTTSEQYRISNEIQNMLIEDFFPPVSSATSPGNTGRLLVPVKDIFSRKM